MYVNKLQHSFLNRKKIQQNHACHLKLTKFKDKSCPIPLQIIRLVESIYSASIFPQHLVRTIFTARWS